jgi:hypothetical protein
MDKKRKARDIEGKIGTKKREGKKKEISALRTD